MRHIAVCLFWCRTKSPEKNTDTRTRTTRTAVRVCLFRVRVRVRFFFFFCGIPAGDMYGMVALWLEAIHGKNRNLQLVDFTSTAAVVRMTTTTPGIQQ